VLHFRYRVDYDEGDSEAAVPPMWVRQRKRTSSGALEELLKAQTPEYDETDSDSDEEGRIVLPHEIKIKPNPPPAQIASVPVAVAEDPLLEALTRAKVAQYYDVR